MLRSSASILYGMWTSFGAQHLRFLLLFICLFFFYLSSEKSFRYGLIGDGCMFSFRQDSDRIKFGKVKTTWFDKCAWIIKKKRYPIFLPLFLSIVSLKCPYWKLNIHLLCTEIVTENVSVRVEFFNQMSCLDFSLVFGALRHKSNDIWHDYWCVNFIPKA